jgi:hypothetical protein
VRCGFTRCVNRATFHGIKMLQQFTKAAGPLGGQTKLSELFSDKHMCAEAKSVPFEQNHEISYLVGALKNATIRIIAVHVPAARRRGMAGAARPALAFPKPAKACRCVCLRRVHGEAGLAHSQTTSLGKRKIFKYANLPSTAQLISRFPPAHRLQTSCRESLRRISRPSTRGCSCALLR